MKHFALGAFAAIAIMGAGAANAVTVHTSNFIGTVTNFNGFEGLGSHTNFLGPYTEGGITVDYVGGDGIWTTSQTGATGTEGQYSWYNNGGANGYTRIRLATLGDITAIQFQAGSGYASGVVNLLYELLNNGVSLATGNAGGLTSYTGMTTFGFDGGTFDEVRLQGVLGGTSFNGTAFEAGAFDAIAIGTVGAVPEPATWAMMIIGFGAAGSMIRRRKAVLA